MSFVERLSVDQASEATLLYSEHIVRYELAKQIVADKTVLDIACGSGYGAEVLLQGGAKKVIAIDIDSDVIAKAKQQYSNDNILFEVGEATHLSLEDNSIDVITSFETIEHINDYETYLKELARVLTGEGVAIISTPNRDVFGQKNPFHVKEFTKEEFTAALKTHFAHVWLVEQKNGLASMITTESQESIFTISNVPTQPLYFIAFCSHKSLSHQITNVGHINAPALERWESNPGWRLVNWIYSLGQKIGLLK